MANYNAGFLSNYFSVTDADKFKAIMASCQAENVVEVFETKQPDGSLKYGFGCMGIINGIPEDGEEDAESLDLLYKSLQGILSPGDAIIITEIGYEKLNYFTALCTIITHDDVKWIDARREAVKIAGTMLGNPGYTTRMDN